MAQEGAGGQVPAANGEGGTGATDDPKPGAGTVDTGKGAGAGGSTPPVTDPEPKVYGAEYVAELRREAAKERVQRQEATAKLKAIEDAQLSEQERKDKTAKETAEENVSLKAELRNAKAITQATKLGAVVPEAIVGLIPADAEDVNAAVNAIKKQFPALFKVVPSGTADAGAGGGNAPGGGKPQGSMNDFLRRAAGRNV